MSYFEKTTPESVGISSEGILNFLDDIDRKYIELHSLMIVRHGKCCASGWWYPYGPEYVHPLCSFSKSLTSVAIGFAEQEGLLSLDEKIADLFSEYLPDAPSENLLNVNLHHLLIMCCGQETEIETQSAEWLREFFSHPFPYKPGTYYKYNTTGTNVLAAVIKKKTGQNVTEYLRKRLLDPLGIKNIPCDCMPDKIEIGGGAMKLNTEDIAKFAFFLLHKGKWEGKQLLRESWFDRACTKQIETAGASDGYAKDWAQGYGYQFWMCTYPGAFRADGAFGQFGIVFPDLDMIVAITAGTLQTQSVLDSVFEYLVPAVKEGAAALKKSNAAEILKRKMHTLKIPALQKPRFKTTEEKIQGKRFRAVTALDTYCSSMEILIGGVALYHVEEGKIDEMTFGFAQNSVTWTVWENTEVKEITADFNNHFCISNCGGIFYAATACWKDENHLLLEIRRLDAVSGSRITFTFDDNRVLLKSQDTLLPEDAKVIGMRRKHMTSFIY